MYRSTVTIKSLIACYPLTNEEVAAVYREISEHRSVGDEITESLVTDIIEEVMERTNI